MVWSQGLRMSETRNRDNLNIERKLPDTVTRIAYGSIAVWSLIRIQVLNRLAAMAPATNCVDSTEFDFTLVLGKIRRIFTEVVCLCSFVLAMFRGRNAKVILRVNSFSVEGENAGRLLLVNGNLQEIYDRLVRENIKHLVIVNDHLKYKLRQPLASAVVFPLQLPPIVGKLLVGKQRIESIVSVLHENLSLEKSYLHGVINRELGNLCLWNIIYRYAKLQVVYFDCPHNCFEAEVVATKMHKIKTVEVYHGGITQDEPSYFQRHLDFSGLIHAVCDEFVSPSGRQTQFLLDASDKYREVSTVVCKPSISLSVKRERELRSLHNDPLIQKRKLLFVTSITDYDVSDVTTYLEGNLPQLQERFSVVSLRLHPEDSKERWKSVLDKYQFIELSNLALSEDIASADALVVVSPTVMLQLKALSIEYVDISRSVI